MNLLEYENHYWGMGIQYIAGIDEAGRGPLAGPVVAAAVIFPTKVQIDGLNDSKKLSERKREKLFPVIQENALAFGVGIISEKKIDEINILQATFEAMHEALNQMQLSPDILIIDGNQKIPNCSIEQQPIVKGDSKSLSIAAASVLAKVTRDRMMIDYDKQFPQYGFAKHKGYPTQSHREAIHKHGYCDIHRRSFHVKEP